MNYSDYTAMLDKEPRKNAKVLVKITRDTPEQEAKYIKRGRGYGFAIMNTDDTFVIGVILNFTLCTSSSNRIYSTITY